MPRTMKTITNHELNDLVLNSLSKIQEDQRSIGISLENVETLLAKELERKDICDVIVQDLIFSLESLKESGRLKLRFIGGVNVGISMLLISNSRIGDG